MIAREDIDAMKAAMPDVLRHYGVTDLGRNFKSPWRDDHGPSCHYYQDTNLVTDFGTGETLDVYSVIKKMEGIEGFADQVRFVAQLSGCSLYENAGYRAPYMKAKRPPFEPPTAAGWDERPMLDFAYLMGAGCLESEVARAYLHGRGFCNFDIYQNVLGYAASKEIFKDDDGTALFNKPEPNTPKGYIVIPFPTDETFCTVHYAMLRAIPGDKPPETKELRPKRYKSPLFREYLLSEGLPTLYVTEGLLDAFSLEKMIGRPVMALGGTSMCKRVGRVLYYTVPELRPQKIVLALDADEAGRDAASKIAADLDRIGIPHADMPMAGGCKDPNDMLMKLVVDDGQA